MDKLKGQMESLLFISSKPLSLPRLAELSGAKIKEVKEALSSLEEEYLQRKGGLLIAENNDHYQMITHGDYAELIKEFVKEEMTGELTRPQLETVTIIAYRGPLAKAELEQIRGVNCSLILRNLMIRGLVEGRDDKKRMETFYSITFDFMRFLGISHVKELPDFEKLNKDINLERLLEDKRDSSKKEGEASG